MRGHKTIEVRTWTTEYRGPLLIHTGQKVAKEFMPLSRGIDASFTGGFIGLVTLSKVEPFTHAGWSMNRQNHLVPGQMPAGAFGWHFEHPIQLEPFKAPGSLGIFKVPVSIVAQLRILHA